MLMVQLLGGIVLEHAVEAAFVVVLSVVGFFASRYYKKKLETSQKVDDLEKVVHGMGDTKHFEGLVEVIEGHDEELEKLFGVVENLKQSQRELRSKQEDLRERIENLKERKADRQKLERMREKLND